MGIPDALYGHYAQNDLPGQVDQNALHSGSALYEQTEEALVKTETGTWLAPANVQAGQYVEYLYYKRCLHREKMVMLPLALLALTLDLAKHPEQAEQLGEHSAAARVYFPV